MQRRRRYGRKAHCLAALRVFFQTVAQLSFGVLPRGIIIALQTVHADKQAAICAQWREGLAHLRLQILKTAAVRLISEGEKRRSARLNADFAICRQRQRRVTVNGKTTLADGQRRVLHNQHRRAVRRRPRDQLNVQQVGVGAVRSAGGSKR